MLVTAGWKDVFGAPLIRRAHGSAPGFLWVT
jgi:hypothetical protein